MQIMAGYDYTTGAFLWKNNQTVLNIDILIQGIATSPNGPHLMRDSASPNYVAYDVKTGQEIWRASTGELPWSMLPAYGYVYHDGVHFISSYDGHVYAYQSTDGKLVWKSEFTGEDWETMTGSQPYNAKAVGADGKLYFASTTEYQMMPRPRFQILVCFDEATGKINWKLPIGINPRGIADGYFIGEDIDNGILYCIGKGPTSTAVTAPNVAVTTGSSIMIKGSVTDISPGTFESGIRARFANGVPAISDADMSMWMDYLYGQNATLLNNPPKPDGVEVSLSVLDSNGNYRSIGTTKTNSDGFFAFSWKPDIDGQFTVYASFAGSESYWPSHAVTSFLVENAPQSSPTSTAIPTSNAELYIMSFGIAIIIAIAVVGALILLMLRKRP
ncbi:PQQ-binding-like beta-propeller repeat protein [Candidatus Bathyarchaeota archaeon A05DMB-2]|jgi:hypothetical protein|nr:PQQ-binding-like beta-propeller repeat protein [Candidatus Bathyarchaeota archaeon A05DMB-2]